MFIPHVIESVFFEIQINERKTIIVGVVYRPNTQPRADIDIFMQKIIEIQSKIKEENKVSYLMGDFNIDLLKVNIHAKTNEFVNDVISQGFLPKITRPTRITPHSATLIDHIYTTKIDGVVCPPNISETLAVRTVKLAHRPRIASTTIKLISKPILLSIL